MYGGMMYRIGQRIDPKLLATKRVAVIGAGSVGGYTAMFLPYPLAELYLVDSERLERVNIERHIAGHSHTGLQKVEVVRNHIAGHHDIDPATITALPSKAEHVLDRLEEVDVILETTNNVPLRYLLNAWAIDHDKPVIYAGVYAGGTGWQVICLPAPRDVCFSCFELSRSFDEPDVEQGDYGLLPRRPDQLNGVDGLVPAVAQCAAMASHVATDILMERAESPHAIRCTYERRLLLTSNDPIERDRAEALALLAEHFELAQYRFEETETGFTLSQEGGSIRFNIRQAPGCPLHSAQ